MIKRCREDEIINPNTNRCVKKDGKIGKALLKQQNVVKCKDDEILNPLTKRCVKKTGKIGKQILKTANSNAKQKQNSISKKPKECKETEILNPITKRCVSKNSTIGRSLLSTISDTLYLKDKQTNTQIKVEIECSIIGRKIIKTGSKQHLFTTLQDLKAMWSSLTENMIPINDKQYNQIDKRLSKLINSLSSCKNMNIDHTKGCENSETLIMQEPLKKVPKNKLIKLSDNFCFDVDELASYIQSVSALKNPLTGMRLTNEDINGLLNHKQLDAHKKAFIRNLMNMDQSGYKDLMGIKHFQTLLDACTMTGVICMADYTQTFEPSQIALARLSILKDLFDPSILEKMKSKTGITLKQVFAAHGTQCIHGIGYSILNICLHTYVECKKHDVKNTLKLNKYVTEMTPEIFVIPEDDVLKRVINIYDETRSKGNIMRIGNMNVKTMELNTNDAFVIENGFITQEDIYMYMDMVASVKIRNIIDHTLIYKEAKSIPTEIHEKIKS